MTKFFTIFFQEKSPRHKQHHDIQVFTTIKHLSKSHQDSCDYHQHSRDVIEEIDAIDTIEGIEDKYNREDRCYI